MSGTRATHNGPDDIGQRPGSLPDVVGAVEPPVAFAMPDAAPLQDAAPAGPTVPDPTSEPSGPPQDYLPSAQQPPLDAVAPRAGAHRDPRVPFSSTESVSQWGRRGAAIDPRRPILTSGGPMSPSTPSAPGPAAPTWAPPDSRPVPPQPGGAIDLGPASPSALAGRLPEQPGSRSLGALCRGLGWGLVASIVVGALSSWLSAPALASGWYFAWRHPIARRPLLRAYGLATGLVLLVSLLGSPTRSGWEQLSWACWMANIGLMVAAMIVIDRTLTPPPRDNRGDAGEDPRDPRR